MQFGNNQLDNDLVSRHHGKSSGQIQTKNNPNDQTDGDAAIAMTSQNREGDLIQERLATEENMGAVGDFAVGSVNRLAQINNASRNIGDCENSRTGLVF